MVGNQNSSFKKTHTQKKILNKCPCGIRELKTQQLLLKGEAHGRVPVHCTSSTSLGPDKVQKGHWKPGALCLWKRKKPNTYPEQGQRGRKRKTAFWGCWCKRNFERVRVVFFVQILASVKALSIKMCGLFNLTLQERLACFVIKQNFIKAMSHIIL